MRFKLPLARKLKVFYIATIIIVIYLFLFYLVAEIWVSRNVTRDGTTVSVDLDYVVVHIDLKGSPPKLRYLEALLPKLREFGANGLLIEYEDMFPYEGKLVNLSSRHCYGRNELRNFLSRAVDYDFEIIPLVQTFGHLEYALKLQEFQHLREDPMYPDSICPSQIESGIFVKHMLEQVIKFHTEIKPLKHIHIGCDEVFHVKKCDRCRHRNESKMEILLQHVKKTSDIVKTLSPDITVLIWDDILQTRDPTLLDPVDLDIEPVSWCYKPKIDISVVNFYKYPPNFKKIWVASAFKGADGSTSVIPDLDDRLGNHFSWLKLILEYDLVKESVFVKRTFDFKGIILTGWSRYSHMDPLCDLLPASIPSLFLNLLIIKNVKTGVDWNDFSLNRTKFYDKYLRTVADGVFGCDVTDNDFGDTCSFEETDVLTALNKYVTIKRYILNLIHNDREDLSALYYYFNINQINMNNINSNYFKCNDSLQKLSRIEQDVIKSLLRYYDRDVINEYVNFLTYYYKEILNKYMKDIENYAKIRTWGKRNSQELSLT